MFVVTYPATALSNVQSVSIHPCMVTKLTYSGVKKWSIETGVSNIIWQSPHSVPMER